MIMTTTTAYVDPEQRRYDQQAKIFYLVLRAALILLLVDMLFWDAHPLRTFLTLATIFVIEKIGGHLLYYGFNRRTPEDRWEEQYYSELELRDRRNRLATTCWLLGLRRLAVRFADRADDAWLNAQIVLSEKDEYLSGEWDL